MLPLTKTNNQMISNASQEAGSASGVDGHAGYCKTPDREQCTGLQGDTASPLRSHKALATPECRSGVAGESKPGLADPLRFRIIQTAPNWAFPRLSEPVAVTSEGTWDCGVRRER